MSTKLELSPSEAQLVVNALRAASRECLGHAADADRYREHNPNADRDVDVFIRLADRYLDLHGKVKAAQQEQDQ